MGSHKQQHTVPEGYLRGFARPSANPRLEVLELVTGDWRSNQNPKKICRENRFYSVDLPSLPENSVETDFLGRIESGAIPLIRRLTNEATAFCRFNGRRPMLSTEDREVLAMFVASMHVRVAPTRRSLARSCLRCPPHVHTF